MFFTYFHSKSQMPHNMKVVPPPTKYTTFTLGDFEVFR
jgi:hypothetical protein